MGYTCYVKKFDFTLQHTNKVMTWVQEIEGNVGEMNNRFEACLLSWCLNYVMELNAFCTYAGSKQNEFSVAAKISNISI